jgi:hypothetical protein
MLYLPRLYQWGLLHALLHLLHGLLHLAGFSAEAELYFLLATADRTAHIPGCSLNSSGERIFIAAAGFSAMSLVWYTQFFVRSYVWGYVMVMLLKMGQFPLLRSVP